MARKKSAGGAAAGRAEPGGAGVAVSAVEPAPAPAPEPVDDVTAPPPVDADARRALLMAQPLPKGLLGRAARSLHRIFVWQSCTVGFYMLDRFEQVLMAFSFVVFCYAVLLGLHAAAYAIFAGLMDLAASLKTR